MPESEKRVTDRRSGVDFVAIGQLVQPVLASYGLVLFDLSFRRERSGWVLRVAVDRPASEGNQPGVTVDVCADISRDLSATLDVADPIPQQYTLEVSTPGVERPLRHAQDYERFEGKTARLTLREPMADGQRVLRGVLQGVRAGKVLVGCGGDNLLTIEISAIKSGHLVFEFPARPKRSVAKQGKRPHRGR